MSLKVLLSAPYMIPVIQRFLPILNRSGVELIVAPVKERLSQEELLRYAGKVDGAICGDDRFSGQVLEEFAPRLKVISKWGTGVDSIDRRAAAKLGIRVCNTPGAFTHSVADTVLAYILAFARRIGWLDQEIRAGRWEKTPSRALNECTLGVIGVGNIGKAVLRRARAFGMRLLGNDIVEVGKPFVEETGVEMLPLEELLPQADFVSLNPDLNPSSLHLMNRKTIAMMPPQAVLINTSRGPVVDQEALVEALRQGGIAGAALDVFEVEPLPMDSPLREMDNVLLGPHNANSSPAAWERVHWNTLKNLLEGLGVQMPPDLAGGMGD